MAELVTKTSAAVAVDDSLTTLIDWTNIENLAGFTIIVENAGGGSANSIQDVQIDTSDDGGATSNLDQHPGVPSMPVGSGTGKTGTFTESAKFVRIRAKCSTGGDTTANAILLADSATGSICTLSDAKDRLGLTDTDHDQLINRIILGIDALFNGFVNRSLLVTPTDVTENYTGCGRQLQLKRYPVVAITSIKQSVIYDFDSADALVENSGYRLVNSGRNGIIYSMYGTSWLDTPDCIQVIYRGGYCAAGQTPGTGEAAMPADLREAAILQTTFVFKRKDDIGLTGVSFDGGSISKSAPIKLLPMVEQILKKYRRPQL